MKNYLKLKYILPAVFICLLVFWAISYIRIEILTTKYGDEFTTPHIHLPLVPRESQDEAKNIQASNYFTDEVTLDKYYKSEKISDGYKLSFLDQDGNVTEAIELPNEPSVSQIDPVVLQFTISCGSPCNYTYFYDTNQMLISEPYFNCIAAAERRVVYADKDGELTVSDMFIKEGYREKIKRNFSEAAVVSNAILAAEIEGNTLRLEYLEGKDYVKRVELITLGGEELL